ncbi:HotDog domain-containing protein [Dichotomocladium elegans]|nr:HotDog domain-containing protein [Dichotomocladium elegans]
MSSAIFSSAKPEVQPQITDNSVMRALAVEEIDADVYISTELWHPPGSRGAYGGQMIAQALRSAWNTVPEDFHAHSMHNYFLIPGNSDIPVIYHAAIPSNIPQPEDLIDDIERIEQLLEDPTVHAADKDLMKKFIDGQWFKARESLPVNDRVLHACVILYASDSGILMSSVRANRMIGRRGIGMMASLDHSIWFHAPAHADEWLYYDLESPCSTDERGVAFGRIFNRQGVLVATTSQEGIVRLSKAEQEKRKANMPAIQSRM